MSEMTPEKLKKIGYTLRSYQLGVWTHVLAAVSAWEADLQRARAELGTRERIHKLTVAGFQKRRDEAQARIEALERERDAAERVVMAAQALMVEWTMEMDEVPTTETRVEAALAAAVAALAEEKKP